MVGPQRIKSKNKQNKKLSQRFSLAVFLYKIEKEGGRASNTVTCHTSAEVATAQSGAQTCTAPMLAWLNTVYEA